MQLNTNSNVFNTKPNMVYVLCISVVNFTKKSSVFATPTKKVVPNYYGIYIQAHVT